MRKTSTPALVRRIGAVVVLLACLVGAVAVYALNAPGRTEVAGSAVPADQPPSDQGGRPAATTGTSVGPVRQSATASVPGQNLPGVTMVASPREDGTWDVVEYVRLDRADDRLDLSRARIAAVGGEFAGLRADPRDLQATAGNELAGVVGSGGKQYVQASSRTRDFVLRYVLDGATVRSVPSKAGRALTALAPIADPGRDADVVQIVVTGTAIRALQCPLLDGDAQLCSAGAAPRWTVRQTLPRRTAVALVQFDLPQPQ